MSAREHNNPKEAFHLAPLFPRYDNAVMEAFSSTVKSKLGEWFESHDDAKAELFDYLEVFYNQRRRHSSAGRMSPAAFERKMTQAA